MSIDMTTTTTTQRATGSPARRTRVRVRRALTVAAAAMAALAGWLLADPIAGIELTVDSGGQLRRIGPGAVAGSTLLAAAAAWALLALLERLTSRSRGTFIAIAVATLLLSLIGPLTAATDVASAVALSCLHLAVAAVLVPGLPAAASRAPRA